MMSSHGAILEPIQRLATSGARAVEPFVQEGTQYLAVPQLATDIPGQAPSLTVGDSDTVLLVFRLQDGVLVEHQRLAAPGGEDAESLRIGDRHFLATASLRSGHGPYEMRVASTIFEWRDGRFEPFQAIETFAAKQWRHFTLQGRHFLALAQGVAHAGESPPAGAMSCLYEWNGERFVHFQDLPSAWGYNFLFFELGGEPMLAYADHVLPSRLFRWNGRSFEEFQALEGASGRAFCHFRAEDQDWLAFACLLGETWLLRYDGLQFVRHQRLSGPGGRELEWIPSPTGGTLVQTNFIQGSREVPQPELRSIVHAWRKGELVVVDDFATTGGTDAAAFEVGGETWLAVSNSLSRDLRFASECCIYRFRGDQASARGSP
jgi:EPTP domain